MKHSAFLPPDVPLDFEYRMQARRPAIYAALWVGLLAGYAACVSAGFKSGFSGGLEAGLSGALLALPPVGAYLGVILWRLWHNPAAGMRFAPGHLEVFDPHETRRFALRDIRAAQLRRGVLRGDACVLTLTNGTRIALPPDALPPLTKLREAFRRRGIATSYDQRIWQ